MLFYIQTNAVKHLADIARDEDSEIALENIARAAQEGKHILTGDREALNIIINDPNIAERSRQTFKSILSKLSTSHSIKHVLSCMIMIAPPSTQLHVRRTQNLTEFHVPLNIFRDSEYTQKGDLLVEDLNDGRLYDTIGKFYIHKHKLNWLKLTYRPAPGGGGSITRNYDVYLKNRYKICFCIADGDKSPFCLKNGDIATQLYKKEEALESITSHYVLPLKSAENLLCSKIIEYIFPSDTNKLISCKNYSELEELLPDYVGCFNLKQGYKCSEHKLSKSNKRLAAEVIRKLSKSSISEHKLACISSETCNDGHCHDCYILRPFGDSLLVEAITLFERTPVRTLTTLLDSRVETLWDEIGKLIISWFCSTNPIRV